MALRVGPASPRAWIPRLHLWRCPACRRLAAEEETDLVRRFASLEEDPALSLPDEELSRRRLLRTLRLEAAATASRALDSSQSPSRPALIFAGLLAASVLLLFMFTTPRRRPPQTVDALINGALAAQESVSPASPAGVVFERVAVRQRGQSVEWPVYRDRQGLRKPRFTTVSSGEAALRERLASAGVSRENPLSLSSFNHWRMGLHSRAESLTFSPSGLVTITTSVPADEVGAISSESLTLQPIDYRPVARGVQFRDHETVEIAELDFKVLPWSQVRRDWFEETEKQLSLPSIKVASAPSPPALSNEDRSLAELQARMVLARDDADTNEQIELTQTPSTVFVHGLAGTDERKRQLQEALLVIPHVSVEIQTPSERQTSESITSPTQRATITVTGSVSQPSPLLLDWKSRHGDPQDLARLSSSLMDSILRVRQQSHALRELDRESSLRSELHGRQAQVNEAYRTLWREHARKLKIALDDEAAALKIFAPSGQPAVASAEKPAIDTVDDTASDSLAVCRKLIAGDDSATAEALPLLQQMWRDWTQVSAALDSISRQQDNAPGTIVP